MAMDMAVALKITAGVNGQQAVDQLRTSLDKLDGAAKQVGRGFDVARSAVGAFLALQAVQAVGAFARETINAADRLDEMSERTGIAVETLSELEFAAKMNGKSLEDVQSALNRVAVKATEAATGNKNAAAMFDALGISVKNSEGALRSTLEITEDIGDLFREISDPTLKAALAVEMFGKQGPTLIPLIEKLQDARKEARDLGAVVGPDFAKHAAEFNDNMDRAAFMAKGFAGSILSDVLPALSNLFKEFRTGIQVFGSFGSALWNIGTTNPFRTPLEQAKHYSEEVAKLEAKIRQLSASENSFARLHAEDLKKQLENTRKLAEYFKQISGYQEAGAGRGFINPPLVNPGGGREGRAKELLGRLGSGATGAEDEASRKERERIAILQRLRDEVLKLTQGEDALTLARLQAAGAGKKELDEAKAEMLKRNSALADKSATEIIKQLKDEVDKLTLSEEGLMVARMRADGMDEKRITQAILWLEEAKKARAEKQKAEDKAKSDAEATQRATQMEKDRKQTLEALADQIYALERGENALALARFKAAGASPQEVERMREMQAREALIRQRQELQAEARTLEQSTRTPEEKLANELDRLKLMLRENAISVETYTRAVGNARDAYVELGKKGNDVMSELKQAIEGWGKSAADAFVKFAFGAEKSTKSVREQFSDLVNSVLQDIARMLVYKNITQPLFSAISGLLPFANGGVMTSNGPLPLNAYSRGGIANSPQLALFGEGRMPEAYVPLPDGRSIPVTMQGGGGTNVVVNVNMETGQEQSQGDNQRGTDLGLVIASVVKQELINQRRPGGLLAA